MHSCLIYKLILNAINFLKSLLCIKRYVKCFWCVCYVNVIVMPWLNNYFYFILERHEPQYIFILICVWSMCVLHVMILDYTPWLFVYHIVNVLYILVPILYASESREWPSEYMIISILITLRNSSSVSSTSGTMAVKSKYFTHRDILPLSCSFAPEMTQYLRESPFLRCLQTWAVW
jgi:hypothetical protein